jgi:phenylalanyl-tRNA synthetase alpha chain
MPYTVPKLTDFSTAALNSAARELLSALEQESKSVLTSEVNESDHDTEWKKRWDQWKTFRDRWIARKNGVLTQINDLWLKTAPKEAKREVGQKVNALKIQVEKEVEQTEARLQHHQWDAEKALLASPGTRSFATYDDALRATQRLDITLPGIRRPIGAEHPVIKTMNEIIGVFRNLGYSVEEGPEVETDYYNFEALNFPPNHPARDTQDTLFIAGQESKPLRDRLLLRTHTSPVQIRTMQKMKPPVRVVCPGKVHRNDALDATHSPIFHQVEGLAVDTTP